MKIYFNIAEHNRKAMTKRRAKELMKKLPAGKLKDTELLMGDGEILLDVIGKEFIKSAKEAFINNSRLEMILKDEEVFVSVECYILAIVKHIHITSWHISVQTQSNINNMSEE